MQRTSVVTLIIYRDASGLHGQPSHVSRVEVGEACRQRVSVVPKRGLAATATERVWDDQLGTKIVEKSPDNEHMKNSSWCASALHVLIPLFLNDYCRHRWRVHVCVVVVGGTGMGSGSQWSREEPTRRFRGRFWLFFCERIFVRKFSWTYLSMLWPSITDMFNTWRTTFSGVWCVKQPSEEEAAATRRKGTAQKMILCFAFLASICMSSRPPCGSKLSSSEILITKGKR